MTMSSLHLHLLQQQTPKWHVLTCVCVCVGGDCLVVPISQILNVSHIPYRMQAMRKSDATYTHSICIFVALYPLYVYVFVVVRVVVECTSYSGYVRSCYAFFCLVLGSLVLTTSVVIIMQPLLFPFLVPPSPDAKKRGSRTGVSGARHREL